MLGTLLFHQNPQILFHHTILSLAKRVRRVRVGTTCGYLDVQGVQYSRLPSGITPDAYIFVGVYLLRCSVPCHVSRSDYWCDSHRSQLWAAYGHVVQPRLVGSRKAP